MGVVRWGYMSGVNKFAEPIYHISGQFSGHPLDKLKTVNNGRNDILRGQIMAEMSIFIQKLQWKVIQYHHL